MKLEPFELERNQSEWEHVVEINLTESGVQPLSIRELVKDSLELEALLDTRLGYVQTNGSRELRTLIAGLYSGASPENILATNGGAEANYLCTWALMHEQPERTEFVVMLPNYMQIHGIVRALNGTVRPLHLRQELSGWVPDIEGLKEVVSGKTAAIAICNPNNPTGSILDKSHVRAIIEVAEDAGAWILSDEIYQGAEQHSTTTESLFGQYEKVLITNSLSKAYGLPGLRLGWIASTDKEFAHTLWAYSDYTTICPTKLSDRLAQYALEPEMRKWILGRTRGIVGAHWRQLKSWFDDRAQIFSYIPPKAAAICFPKHSLPISSKELTERLLHEKSVLLVPGEHFGMPMHLRFGFGYDSEKLQTGLDRLDELIRKIA
ncbi:MAG: aminotransferase class I/II-fold pyridoxal phosphate-dependent enzyme [Candidatus Thorarchaeota archaeon]|nr:aminotransferase class I/II-fold pyridoxal phosphate-dependent enzyme [Candidatus Thorarchaeota archaeon]